MPSVLYIVEALRVRGGIETSLLKQLPLLQSKGFSVKVCALEGGYVEQEFYDNNIPLDVVSQNKSLTDIVDDFKPDIISAHQLKVINLVEKLVSSQENFSQIKIVGIIHSKILNCHNDEQINNFKEVSRTIDHLFVIGEQTRTEMEIVEINIENNQVLFSGFQTPKETNQKARINPDDPRILFVGRPDYRKGLDVLLEALTTVIEKYPRAHLRIVGNDGVSSMTSSEKPDKPLADKLGLNDHITWVGQIPQSKVFLEMTAADLMVVASRSETFSGVTAEAHLRKLPVVGTSTISEIMGGGEYGIIVPIDNSHLLAAAIKADLTDTDRLSRATRAAEWVGKKYSLDEAVSRIEKAYHKVLSK